MKTIVKKLLFYKCGTIFLFLMTSKLGISKDEINRFLIRFERFKILPLFFLYLYRIIDQTIILHLFPFKQ